MAASTLTKQLGQSIVNDWNRRHLPGTAVRFFAEDGRAIYTRTISQAYLLSSYGPVIGVEATPRCIPLAQIALKRAGEGLPTKITPIRKA